MAAGASTHVLRSEEDQLLSERPQTFSLAIGEHLVARHYDRVEVRYGAAGRQNGVALHEAYYVAHLLEHKVFHEDEDGRYLVGEPDRWLMAAEVGWEERSDESEARPKSEFSTPLEKATHMFVFAAAVSHSPANDTISKPLLSWLKKCGCPAMGDFSSISLKCA